MQNKKHKKLILLLGFFIWLGLVISYKAYSASAIQVSETQIIGMKIWQNECGGTKEGLTSWNEGENFASLGIGHCIWYPKDTGGSNIDSFPVLLTYLRARGAKLPSWLDYPIIPPCPWNNRAEFLAANHDPRMIELRNFLADTVALQVDYLFSRLETALPALLVTAPPNLRDFIYHKLYLLMQTPSGRFALVDYVNFKGDGIVGEQELQALKNKRDAACKAASDQALCHSVNAIDVSSGHGLLQVLEEMRNAPAQYSALQAYVWAAKRVLARRVFYSNPERHEERWLAGWLRRVDGYLTY